MKKTEKRLDIHGCVDYYIGAYIAAHEARPANVGLFSWLRSDTHG